MSPAVIVAEVGVNHNGSLDMAGALIDAAAECGADFVKFQTFSADRLATRLAPKTGYQSLSTPESQSHFDMLRELELSEHDHVVLRDHSRDVGIGFLSTPFDFQSLDFLVAGLGLTVIKVGSGDVSNLPLLVRLGRTGADLILSSGMSTLQDVEEAIGAYAYGLTEPVTGVPDPAHFLELARRQDVRKVLIDRVRVLQCTSEYPAPVAHVNLRAMQTLHSGTGLPVGLSDHSLGTTIPIAAVALGACMVEKHLTLDRSLPGPDHTASLDPVAFGEMVHGIRDTEAAMGDGVKQPSDVELLNRAAAGKSLFTSRAVARGQTFTEEDIALLRPGTGSPLRDYWLWLGREAERDYAPEESLEP